MVQGALPADVDPDRSLCVLRILSRSSTIRPRHRRPDSGHSGPGDAGGHPVRRRRPDPVRPTLGARGHRGDARSCRHARPVDRPIGHGGVPWRAVRQRWPQRARQRRWKRSSPAGVQLSARFHPWVQRAGPRWRDG